jgi:hypothetical protein
VLPTNPSTAPEMFAMILSFPGATGLVAIFRSGWHTMIDVRTCGYALSNA